MSAGSIAKRQIRFLWRLEPIKTLPRPRVQSLGVFDGLAHQSKATGRVMAFDTLPFAIGQLASVDLNHRAVSVESAPGPTVAVGSASKKQADRRQYRVASVACKALPRSGESPATHRHRQATPSAGFRPWYKQGQRCLDSEGRRWRLAMVKCRSCDGCVE